MGQHHAFRASGRTGCIDDRGQHLRRDGRVQRLGRPGGVEPCDGVRRAGIGRERVRRLRRLRYDHDALQTGEGGDFGREPGPVVRVIDDERRNFAVPEDEADIAGIVGPMHRHDRQPEGQRGLIGANTSHAARHQGSDSAARREPLACERPAPAGDFGGDGAPCPVGPGLAPRVIFPVGEEFWRQRHARMENFRQRARARDLRRRARRLRRTVRGIAHLGFPNMFPL